MSQPIDIPAHVPRGLWWRQKFENKVTGDRYIAVVPAYGPAHLHTGCWCGEKTEASEDGLELVIHQAPPN